MVEGYLLKDPQIAPERTQFVLNAQKITTTDTTFSVCGHVLVRLWDKTNTAFHYGDNIQIAGLLTIPNGQTNPGGFDYRAWLMRKGIRRILTVTEAGHLQKLDGNSGSPFLRDLIYPLRRWMILQIDRLYPESSRPLMRTLLLGDRTLMDDETETTFARTGIIHILAVSGLHVGFVLLILQTIFGFFRLPRFLRTILVIAGLICFAAVTEARPPVVRAVLMASLYLIGVEIDRRANPFNTIGTAALILLLINPESLFDPGFQLSFSAVFGILYFYPKLHDALRLRAIKTNWIRGLAALLIVSLSAQLGTLPVSVSLFNRLPLFGLMLNLVAIPAAGLIVLLGLTSLIFSAFFVWIGASYAALNHVIIQGLLCLVGNFGHLPWIAVRVPTPRWPTILIYITGLILVAEWKSKLIRKAMIFTLLIAMNLAVWPSVISRDFRKLRYIQFDVGQGDAALIRLPRGKTLLIDGGPKTERFDPGERIVAPYLIKNGIAQIDALVLTHPHADHLGGLRYLVEQFKIGKILIAGTKFESSEYEAFLQKAKRRGIPICEIIAPDSLRLVKNIRIYFLSPDKAGKGKPSDLSHAINNQSLVMRMAYGQTEMLFMGDAETPVEKKLLEQYQNLDADILKVGHHGSATSSSPIFLDRVSPEFAVISVGARNRHGHPSPVTLKNLMTIGTKILRTDKDGAILFVTDGHAIKMETWCKY